jgi:hypothetical protein
MPHKIKLSRYTAKITKNKKTRHAREQIKKHRYYIVRCDAGLDHSILARHLHILGVLPDTNAMSYVEKQYKLLAARNKLKIEDFCASFNKNLLVRIPRGIVGADVFFYDTNSILLDKPFYNYPKFLCNSINLDYSILDKNMLYNNILKYNSSKTSIQINKNHFIEIFLLTNTKKFHFPGNYILRPVFGYGGRDIFYVHNEKDLEKAKQYYNTHKDFRNRLYLQEEITVAKIITDLLLFKGRKFHLRMYYMVAVLEGNISYFLLDVGKIITAKKEYNLNLPFSKDVHDTHLGSTDADYFFPQHLTLENISLETQNSLEYIQKTILEGITQIAKCISNIVNSIYGDKPKSLLFENQKNGYYIYGLDILVRNNLEPVLVECNNQTGFSFYSIESKKELSETVYGWINETILEPLFKHPGHATEHARKHRTYIPLNNS